MAPLLLLLLLAPPLPAQAPVKARTVLYLNSYHSGYAWSDGLLHAFRESLTTEAEIYVEYMDTKRFFNSRHIDSFRDYLRVKYASSSIDLLVAADDAAYQLLVENRRSWFADTPTLFVGVSEHDPSDTAGESPITGVIQYPPIADGVELMTRLHPEAPAYIAITDNSFNGQANEDRIVSFVEERGLGDRFVFPNAMNSATLTSIEKLLNEAPRGSAIFLSDYHVQPDRTFVSAEEIFDVLDTRADLPVYVYSGIYLGKGAVGGKIVTPRGEASILGQMAERVFAGTSPAEMPVHDESTAEYIFDARELAQHTIARSRLPESATVTNTLFDRVTRSRATLITALALIVVLLLLLTATVIVARISRRNTESLSYERNLFHTLMDQVPDPIYFKDLSRRLVRVNNAYARLLSVSEPNDLIGKSDEELYPETVAERERTTDEAVMRTGGSVEDRLEEYPEAGGGRRWMLTTKMPWRSLEGALIGVVAVAREVTGEIEAQRQLESALHDKETLLREVHHRTKNNLQLVVSILNLQKRLFESKEVLQALDEAQLRVHSMAMLHDHLHKSPDVGQIQLGEYLRSVLSNARGLARPDL